MTGQRLFSCSVQRYFICYLQTIGIKIKLKCKSPIEQIVVIAHVDDADFCNSGEYSEMNMQEKNPYHMKTHEATDGKVQRDKVSVCCWKQMCEKIINGIN